MPNRIKGKNSYRYAYQGQEKDIETDKEAFQLRLWDGRIGRWLTVDPYGQYHSPYLGMGNSPTVRVDPDGGADCPDPPCDNNGNVLLDEVVVNANPAPSYNWSTEFDPYAFGGTMDMYRSLYNVPSSVTNVGSWYNQNHSASDFYSWVSSMEQAEKDRINRQKLKSFLEWGIMISTVLSPSQSSPTLASTRGWNYRGIISKNITTYRNMSVNELDNFIADGNQFSFGSAFKQKQFWLNEKGLKMWLSKPAFSEPVTLKLSMPRSFVKTNYRYLDGHDALSFGPNDLSILNQNFKLLKIIKH